MAQKQIKQLNEYTSPTTSDLYVLQKASDDETVKVTGANLVPVGSIVPEKLTSGAGTTWSMTSYSPTWAGSSSNPSIGNGTLTGHYKTIGKLVFFRIFLTIGTTTSLGSGYYTFTLPSTASTDSLTALKSNIGSGYLIDSGTAELPIFPRFESTTTVRPLSQTVSGGNVLVGSITNSGPISWNNGDTLQLQGLYWEA